jgi:hypothetical protein
MEVKTPTRSGFLGIEYPLNCKLHSNYENKRGGDIFFTKAAKHLDLLYLYLSKNNSILR